MTVGPPEVRDGRAGDQAMTTHIAQLNIGRFRYPTDDPRMAPFMANLDRINALAERSEGFVWRLKDESNNATAIRPANDPTMAVNLSVWESVEALERFVWATAHKQFYNRKGDWFEKLSTPHFVMWPIPAGRVPGLAEAMQRLEHLKSRGDSDFAFGWSHLAHIKLWMSRKCG
jgi:hypothetical protein